jgi:hypothetical protein
VVRTSTGTSRPGQVRQDIVIHHFVVDYNAGEVDCRRLLIVDCEVFRIVELIGGSCNADGNKCEEDQVYELHCVWMGNVGHTMGLFIERPSWEGFQRSLYPMPLR